jgi:hypothetical protein
MKTAKHIRRMLTGLLASLLLLVLVFPAVLHAASNGAIAQGYPADTRMGDIVAGSLVSFKRDSRSVELATADSADRLAGVADQDPLLVISADNQEAQVVLGGTTSVLVSDINGAIHAGDKITASPIAGVGMRATGESRIVGTVQADFDTSKAETKQVTDTGGKSHTVHIGTVPVQVGLSYYVAPGSSFLPPFLQSFANSIAGKQVSLIRITFCAVLLLFSFISLAILISSTVRSSMISLGRNPLAAPSIRKSLYQVGGVVLVIVAATLAACYFVLVL